MKALHPVILYYFFVGLAFFGPLLSYISYRSIVPVCAFAAIGSVFSIGRLRFFAIINEISIISKLVTCLFFLWLFGTTLWAPDTSRGLISAMKFLGSWSIIFCMCIGALHLNQRTAEKVLVFLSISLSVVIFLLVSDLVSNGMVSFLLFKRKYIPLYGFFWFKPTVTLVTLGVLVLSCKCWALEKKALSVTMVISIFFMAIMLNSKTLAIAIPFSLLSAAFLASCGKHRVKVLVCTLFFSTIILVGSIGNTFKAEDVSHSLPENNYPTDNRKFLEKLLQSDNSAYTKTLTIIQHSAIVSLIHRAHIWEYSVDKIKKKPFHGWGLGASRYIGNKKTVMDPKRIIFGELLPLHSHNFALQVWLEIGLVGYLILLILVYIILSKADQALRASHFERVFLLTILLICITLWYLNYGAWTSWWLHQLGFIIAMAIISLQLKHPSNTSHEKR